MLKLKPFFKISSVNGCRIKSDLGFTKVRVHPQLFCSNVRHDEDPNVALDNQLSTVYFSEKTQTLVSDFVKGRPVIPSISSSNNDDLKSIVQELSQKLFAGIDIKERSKILRNNNSHNMVKIVDLIRKEMVTRLKKARVDEDKFISLNNEIKCIKRSDVINVKVEGVTNACLTYKVFFSRILYLTLLQ